MLYNIKIKSIHKTMTNLKSTKDKQKNKTDSLTQEHNTQLTMGRLSSGKLL